MEVKMTYLENTKIYINGNEIILIENDSDL